MRIFYGTMLPSLHFIVYLRVMHMKYKSILKLKTIRHTYLEITYRIYVSGLVINE